MVIVNGLKRIDKNLRIDDKYYKVTTVIVIDSSCLSKKKNWLIITFLHKREKKSPTFILFIQVRTQTSRKTGRPSWWSRRCPDKPKIPKWWNQSVMLMIRKFVMSCWKLFSTLEKSITFGKYMKGMNLQKKCCSWCSWWIYRQAHIYNKKGLCWSWWIQIWGLSSARKRHLEWLR